MTGRKARALQAYIMTGSKKESAQIAGIAERTMNGYFHDSDFVAEVDKATTAMMEEATRKTQHNLSGAVDVLIEIATNKEANDYARITASKILIDSALKLIEVTDILRRITALEGMEK